MKEYKFLKDYVGNKLSKEKFSETGIWRRPYTFWRSLYITPKEQTRLAPSRCQALWTL